MKSNLSSHKGSGSWGVVLVVEMGSRDRGASLANVVAGVADGEGFRCSNRSERLATLGVTKDHD